MKRPDEFLQNLEQITEIESNTKYRNRIKKDQSNEEITTSIGDFDIEEKPVQLSIMEELCLIALGEERAQLSLFNDNIPYVLRGCILLELALARRIKLNIQKGGDLNEPWKFDIMVSDFTPTGDSVLDEALGILNKHQLDLQRWIDVLTGETWDRKLASCQMFNLRDRICKSLMEKGVTTSRKTTLFLVETTEYPLLNHNIKRKLCFDIIDSANNNSPDFHLRSLCRLLSIKSAKVLSKALRVTDAPTSSRVKAFANTALTHYCQFHNLEAKFGHLLGDGELHLIAGIFGLYAKINKFF